jgi:dTDP-4-dehydrorhamnose 3,5-epimerase
MEITETKLPGVLVFTPRRFGDNRGYFMETFSLRKYFPDAKPLPDFVQDNESFSAAQYTVRGLHYQAPPHAQDKLVRVIKGSVFDIAVDIREGSPTYGHWVGETLSAENMKQLLVPKGFLHGFMTLEPDTLVAYKVTDYYDGPSDGAVRWDSPSLGIHWPEHNSCAVLSDKDAAAPDFADFKTPFV